MIAPAGKKPLAPQNRTAAQKQVKTQAKRAGKQTSDGSSSGSESDSSIEIQLPPEEPSPIPPVRPSEPLAAARYDTLWAVWSPRNRRPNSEKVKNALVAFKNVVKAVRDTWKERSQAMKTAENKGENDKAIQFKNEVVFQRRLMDVVVSTTLEMGHPMIVEKYVLFLIVFLSLVAALCRDYRTLKRIESLSPCNTPSVDAQHASLNWLLSKGEHLCSPRSMGNTYLSIHPSDSRRKNLPSSFAAPLLKWVA